MSESTQGKLFRQAALERLSSPEQLDSVLQVVTVRAWLLLLPVLLVILAALAWGFLGSIPTVVRGMGIVTHTDGLSEVVSPADGYVEELPFNVGDYVKAGDVVARLSRADMHLRKVTLEGKIELLTRRHDEAMERIRRIREARGDALGRQLADLDAKAALLRKRIANANEQIQVQQRLLQDGLSTQQNLLSAQDSLASAEIEFNALATQRKSLQLQQLQAEKAAKDEETSLRSQLLEANAELDVLSKTITRTTVVTSPFEGRIAEVQVEPGMLVSGGRQLLSIDRDGSSSTVELIAYIAAKDAKKTRQGMAAEIMPNTYKRAESGFIWGKVRYVGAYPATPEGISLNFQNQMLVRSFLGDEARSELRIELQRDPADPSRLAWSSVQSADYKVDVGSLADVEIVVGRQPPAALVVPAIKKFLALD